MVPFQPGLLTVKGEVLGISPDNQYVIQLNYYHWSKTGQWEEVRRTYYRDRYLIEGLYADSISAEHTPVKSVV
jgi:hypothetical protein